MESAERPPQPLQTETPLPLQPKPPPRIRFKLSTPPRRTAAGAIMEAKFRHAVMKLARDNANRVRLTGRHKSLIDRTLTEFLAEFHTPDHPPYSAMIQRAIRELKEKRGSTEESISRYLKKEYTDLPWAHNTLLKHHLSNLCDVGEIIVLRKRFYLLAGANPSPRNSNAAKKKLKRKQRSAPGRMRNKRRMKDEKEEDNWAREEDMEVIEGKCRKELEKLNECEREVEMVEELAPLLELPIKLVEEADEQSKEVPDCEADDHQNEAVGGQSQHLTLDDGFFMEYRCENVVTQEQQENQQIKAIEEHNQQGHFQSIGKDDYLVEGEKQKNSCGDEEALDTWGLLAQQNHNHNLTTVSLSDSNMDLGQLEEEIQPKPLTPERPPGFGVEISDGFSGTRELQTTGFALLKPRNLRPGTDSCDLPMNSNLLDQEVTRDCQNLIELERPIPEDLLQNCHDPFELEQVKQQEPQPKPGESTINVPKDLQPLEQSHPLGKINLERPQEPPGQKKALEYDQTTECSPSGLVNLRSFKVEQQKVLPALERPSKWLGGPTSKVQDIPCNLEKIEQKNTLDLVRHSISLFIPLNLEAVEQEHHEVLPNAKGSEAQLTTEELSFTLQQIKGEQRRQKQLKWKGGSNSEFREEMRNPGATEEKHDPGKKIQSHANGKMAQGLTLNSSKIEKEKLAEVAITVQESISEEQGQQEELLPEPGVMIASSSLPRDQKHLDQEKQPYISEPRRPVDIEQVAVEESSQTARMQRQLKRWDRSTLEQHEQRKKRRRGANEVEIQEKFISIEKIDEEKQAEEPISQPAITIATVEFSMDPRRLDPEATPDVSYPGRPICLDLVSVQQEERVQQKLRCSQWRQPVDVAESMLMGDLHPLSLLQEQTVLQPELPTPERPRELKDAQEGSSQMAGQLSKLRSWKRKNMMKQNVNAVVADSQPSPLALQPLQESKQTKQESNRTWGQRSTMHARKRENRMEQNEVEVDEHLYSPLAFLPPLLPAPKKSAELQGKKHSHPAKEMSPHRKSCPRLPKPEPTSANVREPLPSQYYHEKKQPENSGRGRHLKMKRIKSLAFITLSECTGINLEGKRRQKVPSKAKRNQDQHNQEKPAERKRGRPPKVKPEMDNSEAVLLIPTHSHCSKEAKEEEPKKYRVRGRPPKPNGANALATKKMKIGKKQLRFTKSPRTRT